MSKGKQVQDAERTAIMLDLVRDLYPGEKGMSLPWVVIEEVAPGTGWAARRWADVLALGMWPSKGLRLEGYEIKASRADLKKELSDPTKAHAMSRFCNEWWLVVWDEKVMDGLTVPEHWGVMKVEQVDGDYVLKTVRRAPPLTPEEWPRAFVCSLVRNTFEQSPGAAYVARAALSARQQGKRDGRSDAKLDYAKQVRELALLVYRVKSEYDLPWEARKDPDAVIQRAMGRLSERPEQCGTCGNDGTQLKPFDGHCPAEWAHKFCGVNR